MEDKLICPICGQPTRVYMGNARKDKLCGKHANQLKSGEILLDDRGFFIDAKTKQVLNSGYKDEKAYNDHQLGESKCILCGSESRGYPLCKDCYKECREMEDEIDRNKKPFELKDYYFNLKSANYRIVNKDNIFRNCKMMIALANIIDDSYDDTSLSSRMNDDVKEIIDSLNSKKEIKPTSYTEQSDSQKSSIIRTLDGHIVKSDGERVIDDILYNNMKVHCYEKDVTEISSFDRTVKSDWYIPVLPNKGIYIEYWGMNTKTYSKNKEEKRKIYKENNIPLIEVEKDDVRDVSGLTSRILREINSLEEKILKQR